MKTKLNLLIIVLALLAGIHQTAAQGTAFTYSGQLQNNGSPASGKYDLIFELFTTSSGGSSVAGPVTNNAVSVANGLFTVLIDFGPGVFTGVTNWLQIGVVTNGVSSFTTLTPRQQLTPVPYAITASTLSGTLPASQLSGAVPLAQIPGAVVTNNESSVTLTGTFNGNDGGYENSASGLGATVGNGAYNNASGSYTVVGGGNDNLAQGDLSTVSGGFFNTTYGQYSVVPGGEYNKASGDYSFAAGQNATANNAGSFVWADDSTTSSTFSDTAANQFCVRAVGGVNFQADSGVVMNVSGSSGLHPSALYINSYSGNGVGLYVAENSSDAALVINNSGSGDLIKAYNSNGNSPAFEVVNNGTVYANGVALTSDRNAKENFQPVDNQMVLAKVAALPVTQWNYKKDSQGVKHIGPMAQDFQAAFRLSTDDKHISVVDEGGVALAAIQGLNQKLTEKDAEIQALRERLDELQAVVKQLAVQN